MRSQQHQPLNHWTTSPPLNSSPQGPPHCRDLHWQLRTCPSVPVPVIPQSCDVACVLLRKHHARLDTRPNPASACLYTYAMAALITAIVVHIHSAGPKQSKACWASQSGRSDKRNRRERLVAQRSAMPLRGVSNKTDSILPTSNYCVHPAAYALDDPPLFPLRRPIRPSRPHSRRWLLVVVVALQLGTASVDGLEIEERNFTYPLWRRSRRVLTFSKSS